MPFIIAAIAALILPRVTIVLLWLFSDWFNGVFNGLLIPILGFLFLPTTLLWYSVVVHFFDGVWSLIPIAGAVIAVLIDLGQIGIRKRR